MSQEKPVSVERMLSRALHRIRTTPPRIIASPATQPRRAAVALVIRVVPSPTSGPFPSDAPIPTLSEFFELDWAKDPTARAEILFLRREGSGSSDGVPGSNVLKNPGASDANPKGKGKPEANVAFPGGRMEEGDEGGLYTAMRQTWEEIGLDLAERDFTCIGQLDDREITTSLGKRLLMILSPFVFLQLTPHQIHTDPALGTSIHWTPLATLVGAVFPGRVSGEMESKARWSSVTVDAASRLTPRHAAILKVLVRVLVGSMQFPAILLDLSVLDDHSLASTSSPKSSALSKDAAYSSLTQDILEKGMPSGQKQNKKKKGERHQLKLWGLSLGMTLDLLANMVPPSSLPASSVLPPPPLSVSSAHPPQQQLHSDSESPFMSGMQLPFCPVGGEGLRIDTVAPSLASVFPRFSYPDVNFWIWVFGKRYREVVRGWEASMRGGGSNDRRINWTGTTLNTFYAAVRKALIVVIVLRAIGVIFGLAFAGWWIIS
ncbi:hypothetical protein BJ138DRAFT_385525 [Hygrophoropsis aurantiaca]|uniref:Uncharacterized protein n=1 Tax=Hygrophoropsis aurantiaca TaxID=72124 RepID=A0ACB8AM85_9AGAM|nr:hypothetical protein BJ138DRAFT_385525 [Hygrophoropsis aurantiaca]